MMQMHQELVVHGRSTVPVLLLLVLLLLLLLLQVLLAQSYMAPPDRCRCGQAGGMHSTARRSIYDSCLPWYIIIAVAAVMSAGSQHASLPA